MDGAGVTEVDPHPVGGAHRGGVGCPNLASGCVVLCFPGQHVVVAPVTKVQEAADRHQKVERWLKLPTHRLGSSEFASGQPRSLSIEEISANQQATL